jgi:hypothetical protein
MRTRKSLFGLVSILILAGLTGFPALAGGVPKPLKSRFVVGDPVWRELPVRDDLQTNYDRVWQLAVNALLENNFDIATMDRDSGYIRTTWNEGVVALGGNWFYKVQVSIKLVSVGSEAAPSKSGVSKVRLQVAGELTQTGRKGVKEYFRGYDQVILQNLFQDLQSKLGTI